MKTANIEVTMLNYMGSDLSVVNAARVSFDKQSEWEWNEEENPEMLVGEMTFSLSVKDCKLITYLAKHKHTSPFNHCFASFRVKAPIFVARQLVKHKFLPWNEVSRRYVDSEPEFYKPILRSKADNVKQGSAGIHPLAEVLEEDVQYASAHALNEYLKLIEQGVCPEQARMVLPQNTMTEWVWSGSLGAWADMCRLRLDSHAQKETREVAEKISREMYKIYPVSWEALMGVE